MSADAPKERPSDEPQPTPQTPEPKKPTGLIIAPPLFNQKVDPNSSASWD